MPSLQASVLLRLLRWGLSCSFGSIGMLVTLPARARMESWARMARMARSLRSLILRLELVLAGQLPSRRARIRHCGENLLRF